MGTAKFIVLEGIDGSGKSTQLALLGKYLSSHSIPYRQLHFPRLDTRPFGPMIASFLRGEYGELDQVHPSIVALLYAEDRHDFAPQLQLWLDDGNTVIMDRYVFSNIAFQCAKVSGQEEKARLKEWILELEFEYFKIPKPGLTLYMDLATNAARGAMERDENRTSREYLGGEKDIHEADLSFQESVRQTYLELAQSEDDVEVIECLGEDQQRHSPEEVHSRILRHITDYGIIPAFE